MRCSLAVALAAVAGLAASACLAQDSAAEPQSHEHAAGAPADGQMTDSSKAYEAAMQKMHKDMMIPYTGDVDVDFVRGMIPHHQGAIDQAQVLLKYSKNPRLRRLAGGIIAAQKREIRFMKRWLDEHNRGLEPDEMPDWLRNAPSTPEEADTVDAKDAAGKK